MNRKRPFTNVNCFACITKAKHKSRPISGQPSQFHYAELESRQMFAVVFATGFDDFVRAEFETPSSFGSQWNNSYKGLVDIGELRTIGLSQNEFATSGSQSLKITHRADEDRGQVIVPIEGNGLETIRTKQDIHFAPGFDFPYALKVGRIFSFTDDFMNFDITPQIWGKALPGLAERDMTGVNDSYHVTLGTNGSNFGLEFVEGTTFQFNRGQTYTMEVEIKLNTVGQANGEARLWIDGKKLIEVLNVQIRANSAGVKQVLFGGWYSNSAAGENPATSPANPSTWYVDSISVTTQDKGTPSLPQIRIGDGSVVEGNVGNRSLRFPVSLSMPSKSPVLVDFITTPQTAISGVDFISRTGTITIPSGATKAFIDISVIGDLLIEADETFLVSLTNARGGTFADAQAIGTIINDDFFATNDLSIDDLQILEGDFGFQNASFNVHLNRPSTSDITVNFATANGTAIQGQDYVFNSGTLTIPAGQISGTIKVAVKGDRFNEVNEKFSINLSGAIGARIVDSSATATIKNDDDVITVFRPSNGTWYDRNWVTGATSITQWGTTGDVPVQGDYNGDGMIDKAVWRPSEGRWYVKITGDGTSSMQWGLAGDVPMVGDYNNDGINDLMVYRPSDQTWWLREFTTGNILMAGNRFGVADDLPIAFDFDADGSTDIGVYRRSNGTYWVMDAMRFGHQGWITSGQIPQANRSARDVFFAADFDGDRKIDVGVWNDATGFWNVNYSTTGNWNRKQFGWVGDSPQLHDFDYDGRTDFSVWRPSNGVWYTSSSATEAYSTQQWGWSGDYAMFDSTYFARKRVWSW